MDIIISNQNNAPIYEQIYAQIKAQIMNGTLQEGDALPSMRALAQSLRISVITTMKAYELLESEGLVTAVQGKGFYVNAQDTELLREQHLRRVEDALTDAIHAARVAGMSEKELVATLKQLMKMED